MSYLKCERYFCLTLYQAKIHYNWMLHLMMIIMMIKLNILLLRTIIEIFGWEYCFFIMSWKLCCFFFLFKLLFKSVNNFVWYEWNLWIYFLPNEIFACSVSWYLNLHMSDWLQIFQIFSTLQYFLFILSILSSMIIFRFSNLLLHNKVLMITYIFNLFQIDTNM